MSTSTFSKSKLIDDYINTGGNQYNAGLGYVGWDTRGSVPVDFYFSDDYIIDKFNDVHRNFNIVNNEKVIHKAKYKYEEIESRIKLIFKDLICELHMRKCTIFLAIAQFTL